MFLQNEYEMSGEQLAAAFPHRTLAHATLLLGLAKQSLAPSLAAPSGAPLRPLQLARYASNLLIRFAAVYNLDEADVEGQRKRFDLYDEVS